MAQQIDIVANLLMKVDGAEAGINKLKSSLSKLKIPDGLDKNLTKSFANLDGIFERYRNQLNKGFKTKGDVSAFAKTGKELEAELDRVSKHMTELTGKKIDFKVNSEPIKQLQKDLTNLIEQQQKLSNQALNFKIEGSNGQSIQSLLEGIRKTAGDTKAGRAANSAIANLQMGDVAGTKANIETIIASLGRLKQAKQDAEVVAGSGLNMAGAANAIKAQLDTATSGLQKVKTDADAAKASLEQMQGKQLGEAANQANKLAKDMQQVGASMNQANKSAQDFASSSFRMANQLDQLKSSTQYFFGLRNMINLLKRGFREALDTVKELDAAMTETAVVTKFDVGDMWEKLPEYTANANALGATIQDMYKSATLYYQQGLNQQQAMGIASETMKMARIGGLEAAEATDMMTAALRGFNMELSNTSAQRINDVYSNLAAKTASNTQELGEAMERTASIANSAGMSFEGTSAFLAQMIETTREAPENLGTAMKTIIARFQELKKNPLEMQEIDGEEVSFNKVDAALQTIGVSLKDTNGQFRELDQVFLDIASRWDGLSQTQQRYIATTAAGSRQQSRFIAMMNNYDRTVQLMSYANDSAGASNEQFGKTMESMEAKLNKLKNAWQLFTMGLASNDMLKGAVDGITKIVDGITKLIDKLSFGMGGLKSALTIFTAFAGLRMAGKGVNALLGGLGGMLDPNSSILKGALGGGILGSRQGNAATQAKMINQPIVNVLNQILGAVRTGKTGATETGTRANYKQALSDFRSSANKSNATISGTLGTLKGLDSQQVRLISKSNVGTMRQLQRSMAQTDMGNVLAAQTVAAMKRGNISGNQVAGLNKANIGTILGTKEAQAYSQNFIQTTGKEIQTKWPNTLQKSLSTAFLNAETSGEVSGAQATAIRKQMEINAKEGALATRGIINKYYKDESGVVQQNPLYNENVVKGMKQLSEEEAAAIKQSAALGDNILKQKTPLETFQNGLSHIGGAAITAGQGLMSLGATLNSMGFEAAGAAVSSFGSALSNLGMIANGIPAMLSLLSNPIGAIAAVVGVGIGAIALNANSTLKKIREDGEKVTDSFKQIQDETTLNITNLKTWKEEMATLSKGVDENGLNVNLSDVDYAHYLEIVDAVAKMNPEIVKGYTAQGHAIIENNEALEETLKKQQEIQKEATNTYIDDKALQKLINARNINQDFKKATTTEAAGRVTRAEFGPATTTQIKTTPLATDVKNLTAQLKKQSGLDIESILKSYAIDLTELENGEQQAINQFIKVQDKINSDVSKAVTSKSEELSEDIINGFSNLSDNTAAFDEAIQPVLQNLQTYASTLPGFDNIGPEFQSAINSGLKDIVIQPDLDATQMQEQAQVLIQEFDNLTREGGEYATAMKKVEDAQDQFAASLDASEYTKNTEGALRTLNSLLKEYENNTSAYGQAVTEYLTNQITKIEKFTEEGAISLTESLNTMTNEISAAEGAYQTFQDATKTDFSTAADSMKSIFEEITKETDGVQLHLEGQGDNTLWTGLSNLFSEKEVNKAAEKAVEGGTDAVQGMLNRIKPMLQDGKKGFDAFWTDLFSDKNYAKLKDIKGIMMDQENWEIKWDDDLNPDVFHEMAEALGYSDEFLTSMLNKGRQFANLDFMDASDVRKALSTDTSAIKGTSSTTITNDEGKKEKVTDIFVKGDYLKNALSDAGIVNPEEQKEAIDKITKNGVKIIPGPKDINEETFKHMGISDMSSLIKTLGDTGQFDRSEIEEYAKNLEDYNPSELDTLYKDYLDSQEHPELPSINSIDSNVASILSVIAHEQGQITEEDKEAHDKAKEDVVGETGIADTIPQLFSKGLNKNGEKLTEDEYKVTQKHLDKQIKAYEKAETFYNDLAKTAKEKGDTNAQKEAEAYAADYKKWKEAVETYKEQGRTAFEQNQKEEEKEKSRDYRPTSEIERENEAKARDTANKRELEQLEKHEKEKAAINNAYDTSETIAIKEEIKKRKHEASNYEQTARNTIGPTNGLDTSTSTYKPYALNPIEIRGPHLIADATSNENITNNVVESAKNAIKKVTETTDSIVEATTDGTITNNIVESAKNAAKQSIAAMNEGFDSGLQTASFDSEGAQADGTNISKVASNITTGLTTANDAFMKADKAALAMEVINFDTIGKTITNVGQCLKAWHDKINKVESEADNSPKKSVPTINSGIGAVTQVAQEAVQETQTKFTVDTSDGEAKINNLKTQANDTVSIINEGATFTVQVPGLPKLKQAAKAAQAISKNAGTQTIGVSTGEVDTSSVDSATSTIKNTSADIQVGANTSTAYTKVNTLIGNIGRQSASVTITPTLRYTRVSASAGGGTATVSLSLAAQGMNNNISYPSLPTFGSLAKGTKSHYGQVGPKGKGGLTLTGELGYEVAWLPSENRSVILGANGPQMVNLPRDAVVWTHEQSKEIMKKRKTISAGSMGSGGGSYNPSSSTSGSTGTSNNNNNNNSLPKYVKDTSNKIKKEATDAAKAVKKVSVWWENIARRTEISQRKMDENQKNFDNYLKRMDATLVGAGKSANKGGGDGNNYIKNLSKYIGLNEAQVKKAKEELSQLDNGTKAQRKAEKTKSKKDNKKANKNAFKAGKGSGAQISYEGKNKKTVTSYVNLAKYVKKKDGTYIVDQKKISGIKDRNRAKAIADAANKEIDDRLSKKYKAEDAIAKAKEALNKMGEELYDTFFKWEVELTKIWNITQKIEASQARISNLDSYQDLINAQLGSGKVKASQTTKNKTVEAFKIKLKEQESTLTERRKLLTESQKELGRLINADDEKKTLKAVKKKLKSGSLNDEQRAAYEKYQDELEEQIKTVETANKYTTITRRADGTIDVAFNTDAFEEAKLRGDFTEEEGKAIQDYVKELVESSKELQNNREEITKTITEFYSSLEELKDQAADYSEQLVNISENSEKKKLEEFKSLSASVKEALDKLIRDVKNKLDERRKQEDNAKTERDISQKQQRLSMLRADTAGGHQVEIAQLEKEIADAQQNYQRSLEDQLIEKLQQQADLAVEQRERMIELEESISSGVNNVAKVNMWMAHPEQFKEEMRAAYYEANDYDTSTDQTQDKIARDFEKLYNGILSNGEEQEELNRTIKTLSSAITALEQAIKNSQITLQTAKANKISVADAKKMFTGATYKDLKEQGKYTASEFKQSNVSYANAKSAGFSREELIKGGYGVEVKREEDEAKDARLKQEREQQQRKYQAAKDLEAKRNNFWEIFKANFKDYDVNSNVHMATAIPSKDKDLFMSVIKEHKGNFVKNKQGRQARISGEGIVYIHNGKGTVYKIDPYNMTATKIPYNQKNYEKYYKNATNVKEVYKAALHKRGVKGYKTGGLADYTGPAWLDGTPSKPELVLNAQDTKNFIALKDVLSKAIGSTGAVENTYGNATYEININVDHLNNDYDVDKVVERVKKKIVQDSSYRNVTQVRNFR